MCPAMDACESNFMSFTPFMETSCGAGASWDLELLQCCCLVHQPENGLGKDCCHEGCLRYLKELAQSC